MLLDLKYKMTLEKVLLDEAKKSEEDFSDRLAGQIRKENLVIVNPNNVR